MKDFYNYVQSIFIIYSIKMFDGYITFQKMKML